MPSTRPTRRHRTLLAAVTGAALLASCAGDPGADEAPLPDGWKRVEEGRLSVALPEEWVEVAVSDDLWTVGWADGELDEATYLLSGSPDFGDGGAQDGVTTFVAGAQIGGVPSYSSTSRSTPVTTDTLEVERNDYSYEADDGTRYQGVLWAAADPRDGRTIGLELTGVDLPDDLVADIEATIRVLETDAKA